jgi:hypothetical protein
MARSGERHRHFLARRPAHTGSGMASASAAAAAVTAAAVAATAATAAGAAGTGYDRATLQLPQRGVVHVVGTCHLSTTSAREAQRAIASLSPPPLAVLLELCADRVEILDYSGRTQPLPPLTLATARMNWRTLVDPLFWFKLPFLGAEALVGSQEGFEFTAAAKAAQGVGAQVMLIDRPVGATVTRVLAGLRHLTFADARRCLGAGLSGDGTAADMRELMMMLNPWFGPGAARLDAVQLQRCRALAKVRCFVQKSRMTAAPHCCSASLHCKPNRKPHRTLY